MRIRLDMEPRTTAPGFDRSFTLDGVGIVLRCMWLERIQRWSVEMRTPRGEVLTIPHTVCPSGSLIWDVRRTDAPSGRLVWGPGPDPYTRDDLGTSIQLYYIETAPVALPDVASLRARLT